MAKNTHRAGDSCQAVSVTNLHRTFKLLFQHRADDSRVGLENKKSESEKPESVGATEYSQDIQVLMLDMYTVFGSRNAKGNKYLKPWCVL